MSMCDLRRMFGLVMDIIDTSFSVLLGNIPRPKEWAGIFR